MTEQVVEKKVEAPVEQNKIEPVLSQPKVETNNQEKVIKTEIEEDANFKAFREGRKKDRLEREAAEKRAAEKEAEALALKTAMEAILNKPAQNHNDYGTEQETEDQRIERKLQEMLAQREAALEKARLEREQQEYPQKLQQVYSDFNQTIHSDNLDYLEYHFPEVASPLKRLPDGFDKWSDIYKAIKKFVPNTNSKKDQIKAENNFNKPKSISSSSVTHGGEAMSPARLDEARKAANWERMQRIMKGI